MLREKETELTQKVKQTCWVHTSSFPFHSAPFYLPRSLSLHKLRQVHVCM